MLESGADRVRSDQTAEEDNHSSQILKRKKGLKAGEHWLASTEERKVTAGGKAQEVALGSDNEGNISEW